MPALLQKHHSHIAVTGAALLWQLIFALVEAPSAGAEGMSNARGLRACHACRG